MWQRQARACREATRTDLAGRYSLWCGVLLKRALSARKRVIVKPRITVADAAGRSGRSHSRYAASSDRGSAANGLFPAESIRLGSRLDEAALAGRGRLNAGTCGGDLLDERADDAQARDACRSGGHGSRVGPTPSRSERSSSANPSLGRGAVSISVRKRCAESSLVRGGPITARARRRASPRRSRPRATRLSTSEKLRAARVAVMRVSEPSIGQIRWIDASSVAYSPPSRLDRASRAPPPRQRSCSRRRVDTSSRMPTPAQIDFFARWNEAARRADLAADREQTMAQRFEAAARLSAFASELHDQGDAARDVRPT